MELGLSDRQRRTIAAALTLLAVLVVVWVGWNILKGLAWFVSTFSSVLMPLAVAAVLALLFRPFYVFLLHRIRWPLVAVALLYLAVCIPIGLGLAFFGATAGDQLAGLAERIPSMVDRLQVELQQRSPKLLDFLQEHEIDTRLKAWLKANPSSLMAGVGTVGGNALQAGSKVLHFIGGLLGWAVLPIYLAYFLMAPPIRWDAVPQNLPFLKEQTRNDVVYLLREFVQILTAFFRGQLLCAAAQGGLYAVAFGLAGVPYGVALGLLMGLLNVVPFLGTIVGVALAAPLAWMDGGATGLGFAALAFVVVQAIESYWVTPRIMGQHTGLHPLAIMVALFFWGTALGGLMGLLLAIPLTGFGVVLWRLLKARYIREWV